MTPTGPSAIKLEPEDTDEQRHFPRPASDRLLYCLCNEPLPAACYQAQTKLNCGRWFFTCSRFSSDPEKCRFFKWADEMSGPAYPALPGSGVGPGFLTAHMHGHTHFLGFPNPRSPGSANVTPPHTPTRTPLSSRMKREPRTPGAWPRQGQSSEEDEDGDDDELDFFSTQGSPMVPGERRLLQAMPAPGQSERQRRGSDDPMLGPTASGSHPVDRSPHTPIAWSAPATRQDPHTPLTPSRPGGLPTPAPPSTPSYISPATLDHLHFLASLPPSLRSLHTASLDSLAEHLKRQDRLLKKAEKTALFRERAIQELRAELEAGRARIGELELERRAYPLPDGVDVEELARRTAVHEAQIAELRADLAALRAKHL